MQNIYDSCLIFSYENFAAKFRERATVKKHYFADNGLLSIFLKTPDTLLLENLVAIELRRRYKDDGSVWFYRENIEIYFLIPEQQQAIQVAWSLDEPETQQGETETLELFHKRYADYQLTIITRYERRQLTLKDGTTVAVRPIWQWLLE